MFEHLKAMRSASLFKIKQNIFWIPFQSLVLLDNENKYFLGDLAEHSGYTAVSDNHWSSGTV